MHSIFFKLAFRKLKKTKIYSITNLVGLTAGFSAFILISLFIRYELAWDQSNEKFDRICRIQRHMVNATHVIPGTEISPHTRAITAQLIEGTFPEFEKVSVVRNINSAFLSIDSEHQLRIEEGLHADTCFFDIFSYKMIEGNQTEALHQPYSIVLSETLARKFFNQEKALGQTLILDKKYPLTVTGVYEDLPFNSSLRPEFLISFSTLKPLQNIDRSNIRSGDCMTFALLKPGISRTMAQNKIQKLYARYENLKYEELQLCPLSKVYLNFNDRNDYLVVLKLFGMIGLFILIMSGFNYINLSLAQASMRGKEVAIKKVAGSHRRTLVSQFLSETTGLSLIALCLALGAARLLLPVFNHIVDKEITFTFSSDWTFMLLLLLIAAGTGLLSGLYPALFMSSNKIINLFKENFLNRQRDSLGLKKVLVTFQFAISLFLIIVTASFSMQIKHITHKSLGFDQNKLLYTTVNVSNNEVGFDQLRERMLSHPEIAEVSVSKNFPFVSQGGGMTNWEGGNPDKKITCRFNTTSYNYLKLLGVHLIEGRDFSPEFTGDAGKSCIINQAAANCFGWDNPIGKRINDNRLTVVGVVSDFIYHDMHNPIEPAIFVLADNQILGNWTFAFRLNTDNETAARSIISEVLNTSFPRDAFEISDFSSAFQNENGFRIYQSVNKTLIFFTILNILLAIIGMFGLVSFSVARRTKEIGIRKINGSSVVGIFHLVNREYYLLLIFAIIIAFPGAWVVYSRIPSAHKLPPQLWVFLTASLSLLIIVLISTSYQTLRAASRNPADTLRYE